MTSDSWDWVIDALADELSSTPTPARGEILGNLTRRAGYESADAAFDADARARNARLLLVRRLIARLETVDGPASAEVIPIHAAARMDRMTPKAGCC